MVVSIEVFLSFTSFLTKFIKLYGRLGKTDLRPARYCRAAVARRSLLCKCVYWKNVGRPPALSLEKGGVIAGIRHIFLAGAFACLATGMLLCSCSTGSPAAPESTSSHAEESVPSHEASAPEPASADSAEPVRIGKDQVTVLVLNGCGIEGGAAEVAEKVRAAGFENVTVDNATYFNVPSTRVSYYHEENSAEAEELGDLLKVVGLASVYCYDGDDWAGGWKKDYDILVMVGDPSAADNPIYFGAGPEGESK